MEVLKRRMKVEFLSVGMAEGAEGVQDHYSEQRAQICSGNLRLSKKNK